jgi:hypothetical protein
MKLPRLAARCGGLLLLFLVPLSAYADVPPAIDASPSIKVVVRIFDKVADFQSTGEEFDRTLQMYIAKDRECASLEVTKRNECKAEASALQARAQALLDQMSGVVEEIEAEVRGAASVLSPQDSARVDRILAEVRSVRDSRANSLSQRTGSA